MAGAFPGNYREVLHWRVVDPGRLVSINLLALPLAGVVGLGLFPFLQRFGRPPEFALSDTALLIFLLGIPVVLALHEFVHGVLMQYWGAKPRYGFFARGGLFYAKAPGSAFNQRSYLAV